MAGWSLRTSARRHGRGLTSRRAGSRQPDEASADTPSARRERYLTPQHRARPNGRVVMGPSGSAARRWRCAGLAPFDVPENGRDDRWLGDHGQHAQRSATVRAHPQVDIEHAPQTLHPRHPGVRATLWNMNRRLLRGRARHWCGHDQAPVPGVGRQHAVIPHKVAARTRDQGGQPG